MQGMSAAAGKALGGMDHLRQSIGDILTTRIGTRVMRRDYGSQVPALVDRPLDAATILDLYVATIEAIGKWEPRYRIDRVQVDAANGEAGIIEIRSFGVYRPTGEPLTIITEVRR